MNSVILLTVMPSMVIKVLSAIPAAVNERIRSLPLTSRKVSLLSLALVYVHSVVQVCRLQCLCNA